MVEVLVTGAFGVIGSQVMRKLVERGARAVGFSRNPDLRLAKDIADSIEVFRGDVTRLEDLLDAIKKHRVERIIHAANLIIESETNPYWGFMIGAGGTANVLEAARLMDIERVVYTSSKGVYGNIGGRHAHPTYEPITEDYPRSPQDIYGSAKLMSENMGLAYHKNFGLDFVGLRFSMTWGPGKLARHGDLAMFSRIVENAMLGQPTVIARGGEQKDDIVYVKDVAQGIVKACFAENLKSRFFHVASGNLITIRDFATAVKKIYPQAAIEVGAGLDYLGRPRYALFDISRAREQLGYEPEYGLDRGIKDYIDTMKHLGLQPRAS